MIPSKGHNINGFQISVLSNFYPPKAIWYITSGIVFQKENDWNFLKIPGKLTFYFGKSVTFLFGGGLAANYVMLPPESYDKNGVISKSDFTFDGIAFLGLNVNILKYWKIKFLTEYEGSFTTLYKSFGGHSGNVDEKYYSLSFNLGVTYLVH